MKLTLIPFTILGILSTTILVLVAHEVLPLESVWWLLMLPAYLVHLGLVVITTAIFESVPAWWWLITIPVRLAPFLGMDYILARAVQDSGSRGA